jgi:hypothetical protein
VSGIENVHGFVQVDGSSTVTVQRTVRGEMRVKRSVSFSVSGFAFWYDAAIAEVRRVDDERVAFPVAARVAHVEVNVRARVRPAVERDHARLVDHLHRDRDVARCLDDLVRVAVDRGIIEPG